MKTSLTKVLPLVCGAMLLGAVSSFAQFGVIVNNGNNNVDATNRRIGQSPNNTFGQQWGKYSLIGDPAVGAEQPNDTSLYGYMAHWDGDRVLFGLKHVGFNRSDAIVGWGNDDSVQAFNQWAGNDRLYFRFYKYDNTERNVATMMPNGNVGIGTVNPSEQLHTTGGVRFEGLPNCTAATNLVGIDANGVLCKAPLATSGGVTLTCGSTNFVPKVTGANTLGCSQIYDNGSSVGIGTTAPRTFSGSGALTGGAPVVGTVARLDVNGLTYTNTLVVSSDARFKKNVATITEPLTVINSLNGVSYDWNKEQFPDRNFDNLKQSGFIAQDVEKVYPQAVVIDEKGYYAVNYNAFIPLLNNGIKDLYAMYTAQKAKNDQLQNDVKQMQAKIDVLSGNATGTDVKTDIEASGNELFQNTPNPFGNETRIEYNIVKIDRDAFIMIFDLNGKELKKMQVTTGKGSVTVSGAALPAGMYLYSLVIDGREIATKKMVLSK